ncbi:LytTR family DNA-binding domain-containing protein [Winogradskyella maritima]|uniref:LytR/AlgR family response regulator transcription factor n=1 Tax=Winogradskyella maritima TaxID=1517766 RepID=A0ABV8AL18_9FLAO|nr:LytTR family DNA-binding domain-containing protein [Winogradskyella maritima]
MNCLVVDDEVSSQNVLHHFIKSTDGLFLSGTCFSSDEAFKFLESNSTVDVIFLDINMPNETGLDFYKRLVNPPKVIFTTAYPQFAVDGFEVNAVDYLLKPIAYERFLSAVERLTYLDDNSIYDFLVLNENKVLHKVKLKDILYIEAFGDYVKVHTAQKTIMTLSTFTSFLEKLPQYFLRIHKSFSVNMEYISMLKGNQIIINHQRLPIGQTFKPEVLKALNI